MELIFWCYDGVNVVAMCGVVLRGFVLMCNDGQAGAWQGRHGCAEASAVPVPSREPGHGTGPHSDHEQLAPFHNDVDDVESGSLGDPPTLMGYAVLLLMIPIILSARH